MATVGMVQALERGGKLAMGRSLYARKNSDDSTTFYLRRKVDGKLVDKVLSKVDVVDKKAVSAAVAAAEKKRNEKPGVPQGNSGAPTLQAAWTDFVGKVDWSDASRSAGIRRVAKYLQPWPHWTAPVAGVTARQVAEFLGPIRTAAPSQFRKLTGLLNQTFTQAVGLEMREDSPMSLALALLANTGKAAPVNHHPMLDDWAELRSLARKIADVGAEPTVRNALYLQCLTAQRTGEIIGARFEEFSLDGPTPTWTIPRSRMKITDPRRGDHVLHLSRQTVEFLRGLPGKKSGFLFPGRTGAETVVSEALSKHMRESLKMAGRHRPHSWRSSLRTLSMRAVGKDGQPLFQPAWVESVLDHLSGDALSDSYERGRHHVEAGMVLQWWSDQLLS